MNDPGSDFDYDWIVVGSGFGGSACALRLAEATVPANPGVNPSLTITAMSEYAMSCVPPAAAQRT